MWVLVLVLTQVLLLLLLLLVVMLVLQPDLQSHRLTLRFVALHLRHTGQSLWLLQR
jgi:hypothetical protein